MASTAASGRLALRHHLALRFGLVLCLGVAAILVVLNWWNVGTQRRHMVQLSLDAADRCSALVRSATRDGMLRHEFERVDRILATIGEAPGIDRIRILDRAGRVHSSTIPEDVDQIVPPDSFQCRACHHEEPPRVEPTREERFQTVQAEDGHRILDVITPIYNEASCAGAGCHPPLTEQRVLGIIDVQLPMRPVDALIETSARQMGLGLFLMVAAIVVLTGFLTWWMVVRPIRTMATAAERVAAGDLDARVPEGAPDEVGRLARSWNAMVGQLGAARAELQGWSRTLEERVEGKTQELAAAHDRMLVVEKMASLGKLAAVVAHEINNPLAGIATYAKLLRRKLEQDGEVEAARAEEAKILDLVGSEAARCGRIVRNLLLFSRTPGARFAESELGPVIERCAMLIHHQAELQEVVITTAVPDALPTVVCDPSQIQQVVLALMMNGLEAMPAGGTLTVRAKAGPRDSELTLEVEDTGCGIKAEDLPRVFEPFFTTKDQGEGVGLGLSVVYGIVQRHRGSVHARSTLGEGTTFIIHLPRSQPDGPGEESADSRPEEEPAA